jgi:hypothetical protein
VTFPTSRAALDMAWQRTAGSFEADGTQSAEGRDTFFAWLGNQQELLDLLPGGLSEDRK